MRSATAHDPSAAVLKAAQDRDDAYDRLDRADDLIDQAMRILGADDGSRLGEVRAVLRDVMRDLEDD